MIDARRWADLPPEPAMVAALDHAGPRPEGGGQNEKRRWSEKLAHACAVAIAAEFRALDLPRKRVAPVDLASGTEPLTPLGSSQSKRIDVTVADPVLGLEIGVSLKGCNFRDGASGNYDKNLTGRLYELGDEMRLVHEHLPHAFMAAVLFLPLAATADKTDKAASSFAKAMTKLRDRTGRLDAALAGQAPRADAGFVALYGLGDDGAARGAVRFMDVRAAPPRRGRPPVAATLDLRAVVAQVVSEASAEGKMIWGEAEAP